MAREYTGRHRKTTPPPKKSNYPESLPSQNWRKYGSPERVLRDTPTTPAEEAAILKERADNITGGDVPITYFPTKTINPPDPRTNAAGYDSVAQVLYVEWGDGGPAYNYYNVTPQEWRAFRRAPSPGRYINRVLNYHPYGRA
jgi:hypothetical protein